jgi:hypothetical protein
MAPKGRSRGMLVGVDIQVLDIGAIDEGGYYVKFHLCNILRNTLAPVLVAARKG